MGLVNWRIGEFPEDRSKRVGDAIKIAYALPHYPASRIMSFLGIEDPRLSEAKRDARCLYCGRKPEYVGETTCRGCGAPR